MIFFLLSYLLKWSLIGFIFIHYRNLWQTSIKGKHDKSDSQANIHSQVRISTHLIFIIFKKSARKFHIYNYFNGICFICTYLHFLLVCRVATLSKLYPIISGILISMPILTWLKQLSVTELRDVRNEPKCRKTQLLKICIKMIVKV